ncbi:MAG: hypothetical protein K2W82_11470 [Candidatus Obscuribacterales bacterium]|nr:hypothetical protein [Candidatus Obscuribacterales bacterium]
MRIAYLGKGGSGKTTISAGFIRHAASKKPFVLAIDADVNAHLSTALNVNGEIKQLSNALSQLCEHLKGKRTDLGDKPMIMTTPPSLSSTFVRCHENDELLKNYALRQDSINLLTVGKYEPTDVGSACYHSKLSGTVSLLHHLLDGKDDIVVVDNTAGTDTVATSLWFAYDMHVFVVEPTAKSAQVYKDFIALAPEVADQTFVIGNKVEGSEDEEFLRSCVSADKLLGFVPHSRHLKRFEQGKVEALQEFQNEQTLLFDKVLYTLLQRKRDWSLYLKRLRSTHSRLCRDWYDAYYGQKLDEGLDEAFTYEAVAG